MKAYKIALCISLLFSLLLTIPLTASAAPDGPYNVVVEDGAYRVKRDGSPDGYGYVGGVYPTERDAQRAANKANRKQKKLDNDSFMDDGNCPPGVLC